MLHRFKYRGTTHFTARKISAGARSTTHGNHNDKGWEIDTEIDLRAPRRLTRPREDEGTASPCSSLAIE